MNNRSAAWSDIRVFLAVARAGSTLAASRHLGQSQPTVARRIDALEHALGLTLFERDTRGVRLTGAAEELIPAAEAMERAAADLQERAGALKAPRPIRITAFGPNLAGRTTDIFNAFADIHPEIAFDFLTDMRVYDLKAGEADIAIRLMLSDPDPDLIVRRISLARFTVYASPDYVAAHGTPRAPEDLPGHRILAFMPRHMPPVHHDWLLKFVDESDIWRTYSEILVLDAAILSGQGIGVRNVRMSLPDVQAGRLVACFDPPEELDAPQVLLVSPEAWRRPEVKAFVKFFTPRYKSLFPDLPAAS